MRFRWARFLFLFFFLFPDANGLQAENGVIDSLKSRLAVETAPKARVVLLNELSAGLRRIAPIESTRYGLEALALVNEHNLSLDKAKTLVNIAYCYVIKGVLDSAILHVEEALALAREHQQEAEEADGYQVKGLVHHVAGDYADALIAYHDALIINEKLNRGEGIGRQLNNMAIVRRELKDYEMALQLLKKQRAIAEKINDEPILMACDGNIGYVYLDLEQFDKALPYTRSALNRALEIRDSMGMAVARYLLAECYFGLGQKDLAFQNAREGLALNQAIEYRDGIVYSKYLLAAFYFDQKDYRKAISFAEEAVDLIGEEITIRNTDRLLTILVNSHKELGHQDLAFQYQDQLMKVKEAIFNKESDNLTYRLEADAQLREQEKEKETLQREIEVGKQLIWKQRWLNILAGCLVAMFLVICLLLYKSLLRNYRQKAHLEEAVLERTSELRARNEELQQSNEDLENFAYIASHDLKEPIRNIYSFSNLAQRALKANDLSSTAEYLDYVSKSAFQINALVEGILRYSLLWKEGTYERVDLNSIINQFRAKMAATLQEKNAQIIAADLPVLLANPTEMSQLFGNLIENGIKYNQSKHPTIEITCREQAGHYEFVVSDNGIGIAEAYHDTVFKMFKRLHHFSRYQGTGLGLAIVKRIIDRMNGEIWIHNKPDQKGTTFYFSMPKPAVEAREVAVEASSEREMMGMS